MSNYNQRPPFYPAPPPEDFPGRRMTQERIYRGEAESTGMRPPGVPNYGWAQSGFLVTGNADGLVGMQAIFGEPDTYTVQIALVSPPDAPVGYAPEAEATINWTIAGNVLTRKISVINGTAISGNAFGVNVSVRDVSSASQPGVKYGINILCSRGVRSSFLAPPVFVPPLFVGGMPSNPIIVLPGASADFDIPPDAGVDLVHVAVGTPGNGITFAPIPDQSAQVLHRGTGLVGVLKRYDPRQSPGWEPIAPGARILTVRTSASMATAIEFQVEYGIDG